MANLPSFTDETFEAEISSSQTPVLVDFGAEWCGPCRALAPIVEELAGEYEGRLKVATVDIDSAQNVARKFGIMSVPTLIVFKDGEPVEKIIGLQPKASLRKRIEAVLA